MLRELKQCMIVFCLHILIVQIYGQFTLTYLLRITETKMLGILLLSKFINFLLIRLLILIRHIFNRIVQIGLTAKRMKFIFKKFMDFEKTHGNEEEYNKVKEMAIKYVETNKTNNDDEKKDFNSSIESNLKRKLFIQNE